MRIIQSRRHFLASTSLAAAAGVLGTRRSLADEGPLETTTIRLGYWPTYACLTPESISEELLRAEGFTDVRFVPRLLRKSGWARDLVRLWTGRTVSSGLSRSAEAVGDLSSGLSWVTWHWSACHRQWQRARGVPCQALEVLDGGSEQKLVFGAAEPTEPEPGQGQIVLHVAE
jgi:hypothetical protein